MNSVFNNICIAYFIIIEEKKDLRALYGFCKKENFSTQSCKGRGADIQILWT